MNKHIKTVFRSFRPPFLLLPLVVVFLAVSLNVYSGHVTHWLFVVLVVIGAVSAHISVNTLNEYQDYKSGLDFVTQKTPFSGGSGSLVEHPNSAPYVLSSAVLSLAITLLIGIFFIQYIGWALLPIGLLGALTIILYTKWFNRNPFLCLIAPGLGFGPLMILGTSLVLSGEISVTSIGLSLIVFFQANNLLLLNQFPDIEADKSIGRHHFPIAYGTIASAWVYGFFTFLSSACLVGLVVYGYLPKLSLLALVPILLGFLVMKAALKHHSNVDKLIPFMGMNVGITLATPTLLALILLFATFA